MSILSCSASSQDHQRRSPPKRPSRPPAEQRSAPGELHVTPTAPATATKTATAVLARLGRGVLCAGSADRPEQRRRDGEYGENCPRSVDEKSTKVTVVQQINCRVK